MINWKKVKLSTLCERIGDGLHGTPQYSETSNIFFINGNNIKNGKIVYDVETKKVDTKELEKKFIQLNKNSLLISINGTLGNMAFYKGENIMLGKSAAYLNFKTNINQFYYYYFQLPNIQKYFYDVATGSTIKNLSLKSLQDFEVPLPDNHEYQKIASVLSALDDKIELNNRINAELEAMAKTLYNYWFVQFDFPNSPPKEGWQNSKNFDGLVGYKSSGGKMVYNETLRRKIPEGWEVKKLKNIAEIIMGQSPKGESYNTDGNGVLLINGAADYVGNYLNPRIFTSEPTRLSKKDDLIFCIRATIGKLTYSEKEYCLGRGVASVRSNTEEFREYIYFSLNQEIERFKKHASGSIIIGITKDDLTDYFVLLPHKESLNLFHKIVNPVHQKIRKNLKQNQELSVLRDWLLPMLMNGQVKVVEAEAQVLGMVTKSEASYNKSSEKNEDELFEVWLKEEGLAARGGIDRATLRELFDAMDDEDKY